MTGFEVPDHVRPIRDRVRAFMVERGLATPPQEDHLNVKGLGERLFLESNTLTPILKKLEELGYVRRRRDPDDERQVMVSLTEAGRRLRERGGRNKLASATGLAPEDFARLQKAVADLRDNLIEHLKQGS